MKTFIDFRQSRGGERNQRGEFLHPFKSLSWSMPMDWARFDAACLRSWATIDDRAAELFQSAAGFLGPGAHRGELVDHR